MDYEISNSTISLTGGAGDSVEGDNDLISINSPDLVSVTGSGDQIVSSGSGDVITVSGSATATMSGGSLSLQDGSQVTLSGTGDTVGINPSTLVLADDSQVITMGAAGTILLGSNDTVNNGDGGNVETFNASGTGDNITLTGADGDLLNVSGRIQPLHSAW